LDGGVQVLEERRASLWLQGDEDVFVVLPWRPCARTPLAAALRARPAAPVKTSRLCIELSRLALGRRERFDDGGGDLGHGDVLGAVADGDAGDLLALGQGDEAEG